jgi:hypothetical protein
MNTLFSGSTETVTIDPNKNYLEELVGEGKKFKTVEDLARGKYESDTFIPTLTAKMDELRADYQREREQNIARAKLEELIDKLQNPNFQQNNSSNEENRIVNENKAPAFSEEDIDKIVQNKIMQSKVADREQSNYDKVLSQLKERFGNNYSSVLNVQVKALGLDNDDVERLARKSPQAFFNTLGLNESKKETLPGLPRSSMRSDNFSPNSQERTWSWYQDLKKKDPELYYTPKMTNQMHEDYARLGDKFEDGDFNQL